MSNLDLLNLQGWVTVDAKTVGDGDLEVTAEPSPHRTTCPHCGEVGQLVKLGYTLRTVFDVPRGQERVAIHLKRQRYKCKSCGKLCHSEMTSIDPDHDMTVRLARFIEARVLEDRFTHVASHVGVHDRTVRNVFARWRDAQEATFNRRPPHILGLDEIHVNGTCRAVLVDVEHATFIDLLENRREPALVNRLYKWEAARHSIRLVTTDMFAAYRPIIHKVLPQAEQVVDKFHVLRQAELPVQYVRRHSGLPKRDQQRLNREWKTLRKHTRDLSPMELQNLELWYRKVPMLKAAYEAKEGFYDVFYEPQDPNDKTKRIEKTRDEGEALYKEWLDALSDDQVELFYPLIKQVQDWHDEIFRFFNYHVTNALTESLNSVARQMERMSYGLSFEILRAKVLYLLPHKKVARRPRFGQVPESAMQYQYGPYTPKPVETIDLGVSIYTLLQEFTFHGSEVPISR